MKQFPMPHQREKITLMIVNKLSMLPRKRKVRSIWRKNIYRDWKTSCRDNKKLIKSELEQNKVDNLNCKRIKKYKTFLKKSKKEEPINVENFFIDDNVFESGGISNADREFIIDFITDQILLPILKDSLKNQMRQKWKLFILRKKKLRRKNKCQLLLTKNLRPVH